MSKSEAIGNSRVIPVSRSEDRDRIAVEVSVIPVSRSEDRDRIAVEVA